MAPTVRFAARHQDLVSCLKHGAGVIDAPLDRNVVINHRPAAVLGDPCTCVPGGDPNQVAPRKRPFHTIIPGFLTRDGAPLASFGLMGGSMQAQGHLQVVVRIADHGQNPQAASDAPRWRVLDDNATVALEWNFPADAVAGLKARGHEVRMAKRFDTEFGSAQFAMKTDNGYIAASDHRKDGYPVGF